MLEQFISEHQLNQRFKDMATLSYIPMAQRIEFMQREKKAPLFIGVNGCQGSGKSTLTAFLAKYLEEQFQLSVVVLSLDDFYLSSQKRLLLAQNIHPFLKTRGVPGTHDTQQLNDVLKSLQQHQAPICVPRFNKATDNPHEPENWTEITEAADVILMEGWCWGALPETPKALKSPVNRVELYEDVDLTWRNFVNEQLQAHYLPLYQYIDFWIFLQAPSFDSVYQWRLEQEHKLAAKQKNGDNNKVMTDQELLAFIQLYQRLTEQSLRVMPEYANMTLVLNEQRDVINVIEQSTAKCYA